MNLLVKYFNSLKDPPSSKVYSGNPNYRTTLGKSKLVRMMGRFEKSEVKLHCVAGKES